MKKFWLGIILLLVLGAFYLVWSKLNIQTGLDITSSGITGIVLLGPTCPVVQDPPDPECDDKPYATKLVLTTADQAKVINEFNSDSNGRFNIAIKPGEYAIRSSAASNIWPYCSSSGTIKVAPNSFVESTVYCDTGIR